NRHRIPCDQLGQGSAGRDCGRVESARPASFAADSAAMAKKDQGDSRPKSSVDHRHLKRRNLANYRAWLCPHPTLIITANSGFVSTISSPAMPVEPGR